MLAEVSSLVISSSYYLGQGLLLRSLELIISDGLARGPCSLCLPSSGTIGALFRVQVFMWVLRIRT